MRVTVAAMTLVLVAGCGDGNVPMTQTDDAANASAAAAPTGSVPGGQVLALGLTVAQIDDADIVDYSGRDLGDVEGLVMGPDGALSSLIVEVDGTQPDRLVTLPIAGLSVVENGGDRDLRVTMTAEQLRALPAATR